VPAHAVELTSAYLDRSVMSILARHQMPAANLLRKQEMATLIHLCGAGAGEDYAKRGFRLLDGQRCGDHEARVYLTRVAGMRSVFQQLAAVAAQ